MSLIVVNGAGSLEVEPGVQLVDTPNFPKAWKPLALAHREALAVLNSSAIDLDVRQPRGVRRTGKTNWALSHRSGSACGRR